MVAGVFGGCSRLNPEYQIEIADFRSCRVINSFIGFKCARLIAVRNKNARFNDSGVFIYGYRCSHQFSNGISTCSSGDSTMNTNNLAGLVALAFFETRCSEPAGSYQY